MSNPKIITMAGELGSGKTTVIKLMNEKLGYHVHSNGAYFRTLALEHGMSVTEFNEFAKGNDEIDKAIEAGARKIADERDCLIIDARLGWYAVPESFKVYLTVDSSVAAYRAFHDPNRKATEKFDTVEEQKADMQRRFKLENERYFKLYGVHKEDLSNYDFVLDTTNIKQEEAARIILEAYQKWLES